MAKAFAQREVVKVELILTKEECETLADFLERQNENSDVLTEIMVELKNSLYSKGE